MHHLFKSYGDFAELVDFVYWFNCIVKGLSLQPVCASGLSLPALFYLYKLLVYFLNQKSVYFLHASILFHPHHSAQSYTCSNALPT